MRFQLLFLTCISLFAISTQQAQAQLSTQHAIGGRFGSASGIAYRYSLNDVNAVEGIMSWQSSSSVSRFRIVGLYEFHKPLMESLSWYYGFGGSIGSHTYKAYSDNQGNRYDKDSGFLVSIDGVVGLEFLIPSTPIAVSLDAKPYIDLTRRDEFRIFDSFGFTIKYLF